VEVAQVFKTIGREGKFREEDGEPIQSSLLTLTNFCALA